MTDFWRVINVVVVLAVVTGLILWRRRAKRQTPKSYEPAKFNKLANRKQKLALELKAYEEDINKLETDSRQMMDEYFAGQEVFVKKLVKDELDMALDEMEAKVKAEMRRSFDEAKARLQKHNA